MRRKIKSLLIIVAIVIASVVLITITTNKEPYSERKVCPATNGVTSGFVSNGCPLTDAEYAKVQDYVSSGIFARQPAGSAIFFVALVGSITVLVWGLKNLRISAMTLNHMILFDASTEKVERSPFCDGNIFLQITKFREYRVIK